MDPPQETAHLPEMYEMKIQLDFLAAQVDKEKNQLNQHYPAGKMVACECRML